MDGSSAVVLPIPRLRLTRHGTLHESPGAAPSRGCWQDTLRDAGDYPPEDVQEPSDEDQPTPRMRPAATLLDSAETPAARLRAVLSRIPAPSKKTAVPHSSDNESDFDPPNGKSTTVPSFAQKSLKEIFSHALRDSGNTPKKVKVQKRRNSIDMSEVDASPRVQRERDMHKRNRKSLSDEEIEHFSPSQFSETSVKASPASTFDLLRERLTNSHTQIKDIHLSDTLYKHGESDSDNPPVFPPLDASNSTPPVATSTPQQSLRISVNSQFPFRSNLMEQDSEMQRVIEGLDSYEAQDLSHLSVSSPSSRTETQNQATIHTKPSQRSQPSLSLSYDRSHSSSKTHVSASSRRGHEDLRSSSRLSSHTSGDEHLNVHVDTHERERNWNKPKTAIQSHTPDHSTHSWGSHSGFPGVGVSRGTHPRKGSSSTLQNHADSQKRDSSGVRTSSSIHPGPQVSPRVNLTTPNVSERPRTQSLVDPTKLDSSIGLRPRTLSFTDSSRANSPAGSVNSSHGDKDSSEDEMIHERERNWNAPRPKWTHHDPSRHDASSGDVNATAMKKTQAQIHDEHASPRASLTLSYFQAEHRSPDFLHVPSSVPQGKPNAIGPHERSRLSHLRDEAQLRALTFPPRPESPLPIRYLAKGKGTEQENRPPPSTDSTALTFPLQHGPSSSNIQPTLDEISHHDPSRDPLLRVPSILPEDNNGTGRASFYQQVSSITSTSEQKDEHLEDMTPTIRTIPPPSSPPETPRHIPRNQPSPQHEGPTNSPSKILNPTDAEPIQSGSPRFSPPISSHRIEPPSDSFISTPPRRLSFSSSRIGFDIPSTPKGVPPLPGPPTSSSDSDLEMREPERRSESVRGRPDLTVMKTPKPPGAWAFTPAPSRDIPGPSSGTKTDEEQDINEHVEAGLRHAHMDQTSTKTPKPPGAWAVTPTLGYRGLPVDEPSINATTPRESLLGGSALLRQTPKPPGAWMATPAVRKSIMKVRFETQVGAEGTSNDTSKASAQDMSVEVDFSAFVSPKDEEDSQKAPAEPPTPEPPAAVLRTPSRKSGIRILDAFGAEISQDDKKVSKITPTPKGKSAIRVVDAMGRSMDSSEQLPAGPSHIKDESFVSLKHNEALLRVRQGLSELAEDLEDMDRNNDTEAEHSRMRELNATSQAARESREQLSRTFFHHKIASFPVGPEPNSTSVIFDRSFSFRMFLGAVFLQLVIILILYRVSIKKARDLFLATYFDPFYPDLHLYTSRPGTLYHSMFSASTTPWLSVSDTQHYHGWRAFAAQIWDNLLMTVGECQHFIWERFGNDGNPRNVPWPPT